MTSMLLTKMNIMKISSIRLILNYNIVQLYNVGTSIAYDYRVLLLVVVGTYSYDICSSCLTFLIQSKIKPAYIAVQDLILRYYRYLDPI